MITWPRRRNPAGLPNLAISVEHAVVVGHVIAGSLGSSSRVSLWNINLMPQNLLMASNLGGTSFLVSSQLAQNW